MNLTVYLLDEKVTGFPQALIDRKVGGEDGFAEIQPSRPLPFEAIAYIQKQRATKPKWLSLLEGYFDPSDLDVQNMNNSFILLIKVEGRIFAVTTGYGFAAIVRDRVEPNFGLKVVLNEVDPNHLRELKTRKVDVSTRQTQVYVSRDSPLADFDIDLDADLIQLMTGVPRETELAKRLRGADSLTLTADIELDSLGDRCARLLQSFAKEAYKESFAFIDHVRAVKDEGLCDTLDQRLIQALQNRQKEGLVFAYPDTDILGHVEQFRVYAGYQGEFYEDILTEHVFDFLNRHGMASPDPKKLKVVALDGNGNALTPVQTLYDYVVFETEHQSERYLLSLRRWYRLDRDFADSLDAEVAGIPDIASHLHPPLPAWPLNQNEDWYNNHAAKTCSMVLLDKANFHISGPGQVEVCDLLSRDAQFFCVKKYNGSSTLSHLFSQAYVSSALLLEEPSYREFVLQKIPQDWQLHIAKEEVTDRSQITFVLAIATERSGPLAKGLPFFSKVNLMRAVRDIRRPGYKVAICRIDRPVS